MTSEIPSSVPHEDNIAVRKQLLRRQIREEVRALDPAYCAAADRAIREILFSLPEYGSARTVFCFVSLPSEVNTRPILEHILSSGKTLAVPRSEGNGVMQAHVITDPEKDLSRGMYGIEEPSVSLPVLSPEAFDLILVPCCTCSHTGKRLGFGGGYYDRFLARTDAFRIALCREVLIKNDIPEDPYDLSMDIVLTEAGIWR